MTIDAQAASGQCYSATRISSLDLIQRPIRNAGTTNNLSRDAATAEEAKAASIRLDELWLRGGFPDCLTAQTDEDSYLWRQAFVRSYHERAVPISSPRMPAATSGRFWTMLANRNPLNSAQFAQGLVVSAPMIGRYIDLLVDLMLVRRLQPWRGNLGKRLVKSPKIFVRDSGLDHAHLKSVRFINR